MSSERVTWAAGGIVWRTGTGRSAATIELLLIHRPAYDDWTFPKGKVDPGETLQQTAVREIEEETGLTVRLGHPLTRVTYQVTAGTKYVRYWCARLVGDEPEFVPNREVDTMRWVGVVEAAELLSYSYDRDLLGEFVDLAVGGGHRTRTLVVLRHGKAVARDAFDGPDEHRPLSVAGAGRSHDLVPLLEAYGVSRVVSSPALRCTDTVTPFADQLDVDLQLDAALSEATTGRRVQACLDALMERKRPTAVCSHRPTLPWIFEAAGTTDIELAPGEGVVVHHRKGQVLHTETLRLGDASTRR